MCACVFLLPLVSLCVCLFLSLSLFVCVCVCVVFSFLLCVCACGIIDGAGVGVAFGGAARKVQVCEGARGG